jgi:hypothetical protein
MSLCIVELNVSVNDINFLYDFNHMWSSATDFRAGTQYEISRKSIQWEQWRTQEFFRGSEVQQIQLRTEGRENGDLGTVAP